jgi:hypothetical protein
MVAHLKRVTISYNSVQDRVSVAGESDAGPTVVTWLTQRLLLRVVPALLDKLDKEVARNVPAVASQAIQSFAQEAARAALPVQAPVAQEGNEQSWLVSSVDISTAADRTIIDLRGRGGECARLAMNAQELRQCLSILHQSWTAGGWPAAVWPDWVASKATSPDGVVH